MKVILNADKEPALQALVKRLIGISRVDCHNIEAIASEDSVAYDSQYNGSKEISVPMVRGFFRTTKLRIEARIARSCPGSSSTPLSS